MSKRWLLVVRCRIAGISNGHNEKTEHIKVGWSVPKRIFIHEINKTACCNPETCIGNVRHGVRAILDDLGQRASKTHHSKDVKPNNKQWITSFRRDQLLMKFDNRAFIFRNHVRVEHTRMIHEHQADEHCDEAVPFDSRIVMVDTQLSGDECIADAGIDLSWLTKPFSNRTMILTL